MTNKINNGDMPVMPIKGKNGQFLDFATDCDRGWFDRDGAMMTTGMTKREYFAAMAMQGYIAGGRSNLAYLQLGAMKECVKAADRLIEALEANNG